MGVPVYEFKPIWTLIMLSKRKQWEGLGLNKYIHRGLQDKAAITLQIELKLSLCLAGFLLYKWTTSVTWILILNLRD